MTPIDIITEVLSSEEEIRLFCKANEISDEKSPLFRLVIEAFLYLQKKIEGDEKFGWLNAQNFSIENSKTFETSSFKIKLT